MPKVSHYLRKDFGSYIQHPIRSSGGSSVTRQFFAGGPQTHYPVIVQVVLAFAGAASGYAKLVDGKLMAPARQCVQVEAIGTFAVVSIKKRVRGHAISHDNAIVLSQNVSTPLVHGQNVTTRNCPLITCENKLFAHDRNGDENSRVTRHRSSQCGIVAYGVVKIKPAIAPAILLLGRTTSSKQANKAEQYAQTLFHANASMSIRNVSSESRRLSSPTLLATVS